MRSRSLGRVLLSLPAEPLRVLRAVWISGHCALTVGQMPIPDKQNEMSAFGAFLTQLLADYGKTEMLQVISLDAGYNSLENATLINDAQRGYLNALKNSQKDLLDEAGHLLAAGGGRMPRRTGPIH